MKKIIIIFTGIFIIALGVIGVNTPPHLNEALDGEVKHMALQSDGRVLVGGDFREGYLLRLNHDNTIDANFASEVRVGLFNRSVNDFVVLKDDSIIVVGEFTSYDQSLVGYIAKLKKNGELDTDFAANSGTGFNDEVYKVKALPNGKLIIVGQFSSYNGDQVQKVALLNDNGTLDLEFNEGGSGFDQAPVDIALSKDGQDIFLSGHFTSYNDEVYPYVIKMNQRGVASETFGLIE